MPDTDPELLREAADELLGDFIDLIEDEVLDATDSVVILVRAAAELMAAASNDTAELLVVWEALCAHGTTLIRTRDHTVN